jgi:hypothetical protein
MGTNAALYKQDFFAWTQTTAAMIRAGKWYDIASEVLAEEVESLGVHDHREMRRRLQRLVMHLLQWQYQPSRRQTGHSPSQQPSAGAQVPQSGPTAAPTPR